MNKSTIELYKAAIEQLRQYISTETNEENIEHAAAKISDYRFKIADAAFDDITFRTPRLTTLMFDLKAVIANASNTPSVSGAIGKLKGLVTGLQAATGKS